MSYITSATNIKSSIAVEFKYGEVKKLYGSGPRAQDFCFAHGTFFYFPYFTFILSRITRKAIVCGKRNEVPYSLVLNKRPPLINFWKFSLAHRILFGPPVFSVLANFNSSTCKICKYLPSIKGILTSFCVPEVYSRIK